MNEIRTYALVVDDMCDAADSMADLLALWGYDADARYCGASALAAVHARRPDVVLLDIAMPRMTGFEFAARFRALPGCAYTPVVVVSRYTSETHRARARELGVARYLFKPADPCLLRVLLGRLTSAHKPPPPAPRRQRRISLGNGSTNDTPVREFPTELAHGFRQAV